MRCPFCKAPLRETDPGCGGCGISLEKIDTLLGAVPRLVSGLSDGAGIISRKDSRRILGQLNETHILFPQVEVSVVTLDGIPDNVNLGTYTFWLFNRSDVVRQFDTEGRNHDILLTIDASGRRAALTVGYGLEPLVGERHLTEVLAAGEPMLVADSFTAAVLAMLEAMQKVLREVATGARAAFALPADPEAPKRSIAEAALDY